MAQFCSAAMAGGISFFQAEDGIRSGRVTGVQTCALPISAVDSDVRPLAAGAASELFREVRGDDAERIELLRLAPPRSEERRVGKECGSRWGEGGVRRGGG